jgi:hypothetical protein
LNIVILMRDGTKREFKHEGRAGGSYTKSVRYEGGFCIVTDEWYGETAIPQELIAEVKAENTNERRW